MKAFQFFLVVNSTHSLQSLGSPLSVGRTVVHRFGADNKIIKHVFLGKEHLLLVIVVIIHWILGNQLAFLKSKKWEKHKKAQKETGHCLHKGKQSRNPLSTSRQWCNLLLLKLYYPFAVIIFRGCTKNQKEIQIFFSQLNKRRS